VTPSAALGRITAYVSRLSFAGLLERCRVSGVRRGSGRSHVSLVWSLPDSTAPGAWDASVTVALPDSETDDEWTRRLLAAIADVAGHEIGEAVLVDGAPVASPHDKPRVWPWRVQDREGGEA
jgi:hypothetical protein